MKLNNSFMVSARGISSTTLPLVRAKLFSQNNFGQGKIFPKYFTEIPLHFVSFSLSLGKLYKKLTNFSWMEIKLNFFYKSIPTQGDTIFLILISIFSYFFIFQVRALYLMLDETVTVNVSSSKVQSNSIYNHYHCKYSKFI